MVQDTRLYLWVRQSPEDNAAPGGIRGPGLGSEAERRQPRRTSRRPHAAELPSAAPSDRHCEGPSSWSVGPCSRLLATRLVSGFARSVVTVCRHGSREGVCGNCVFPDSSASQRAGACVLGVCVGASLEESFVWKGSKVWRRVAGDGGAAPPGRPPWETRPRCSGLGDGSEPACVPAARPAAPLTGETQLTEPTPGPQERRPRVFR